jgi:hypothetical protein
MIAAICKRVYSHLNPELLVDRLGGDCGPQKLVAVIV